MRSEKLKALLRHPDGRGIVLMGTIVATVLTAGIWLPRPRLTVAIQQGVEGVALKRVLKRFSEYRGISIEVVQLPYDQLRNSEMTELGNPESRFDVVMLDDPWLYALITTPSKHSKNANELPDDVHPALHELRLTEEECNTLGLDDFVPSTLRVAQYMYPPEGSHPPTCGDRYFALPFVGNSQMFCYRKTAFPNGPPKDWDEVLRVSRQLKANVPKGPRLVLRVGPGNSIVTDFMPILWSFDPRSFPVGKAEFLNKEHAAQAFDNLAALAGDQNLGGASVDDFDLAVYMTSEHGAAMSIVWSAWAMAMQTADAHLNENVSFVPMPGGQPELGVWLLAIPNNLAAGHWKEAKDLVLYATSREQIRLAATEGNPPPRRSVLASSEGSLPTFGLQLESLQSARPRPRTRYWQQIEDSLGSCLIREIGGISDAKECMSKACVAGHPDSKQACSDGADVGYLPQ
jgi:multiple sugar transport system substrate-binding protein